MYGKDLAANTQAITQQVMELLWRNGEGGIRSPPVSEVQSGPRVIHNSFILKNLALVVICGWLSSFVVVWTALRTAVRTVAAGNGPAGRIAASHGLKWTATIVLS